MPSVAECVKVTLLHRAHKIGIDGGEAAASMIFHSVAEIAARARAEFGYWVPQKNEEIDRFADWLDREEFSIFEDVMDGSI